MNQTPIRIGVDGFNMAMTRGTGVATYARTLTTCLTRLGHPVDVLYGMLMGPGTPEDLRETLFFDGLGHDRVRKTPFPFTTKWASEVVGSHLVRNAFEIPLAGRVVSSQLRGRLPDFTRLLNVFDLFRTAERHFRRSKRFMRIRIPNPPSIMHWTYPLPILLEGARNIYTLHDLVPLRLPFTTLDNKRYYHRLIRGCLTHADHICTVSDTSRDDILKLFPVDPSRVTNTYQSVVPPRRAREMTEDEVAAQVRGLYGLEPRGFFLFFGAIEPKKNVARMVEAYLTAGLATPLVIVGARAWKNEAESALLADGSAALRANASRLIQLDYLPVDMLFTLVRAAKAVLFPSLYEGFGLPVLEAMALGTPTLTSTQGSLPEIAGAHTVAVDPYDTPAIAAGIVQLDRDAALRARIAEGGLRQAEQFSMPEYERRVAAMYAAILSGPSNRPILQAAP